MAPPLVSIHLMLLLIRHGCGKWILIHVVSIHLMLLLIPYPKGLFYFQIFPIPSKILPLLTFFPTSQYTFPFYPKMPKFSSFFFFFLFFHLVIFYIIKSSPVLLSGVPNISSPNTLSFFSFIIQTKSSLLSITFSKSPLSFINKDGVISPLKTEY